MDYQGVTPPNLSTIETAVQEALIPGLSYRLRDPREKIVCER